jgi:hypothetical protein
LSPSLISVFVELACGVNGIESGLDLSHDAATSDQTSIDGFYGS